MLFNKRTSLIRIYSYSDAERGYGDRGTFKYVRVSTNEFEEKINKAFDGSTYITYEPKDELLERLEAIGYNGYGMGFEFATEEEYNKELEGLRLQLERLEIIY